LHFLLTEAIPFWYPDSSLARIRAAAASIWKRWPFEGFGGWGPGGGVSRIHRRTVDSDKSL
jgi:hypothetical protein